MQPRFRLFDRALFPVAFPVLTGSILFPEPGAISQFRCGANRCFGVSEHWMFTQCYPKDPSFGAKPTQTPYLVAGG